MKKLATILTLFATLLLFGHWLKPLFSSSWKNDAFGAITPIYMLLFLGIVINIFSLLPRTKDRTRVILQGLFIIPCLLCYSHEGLALFLRELPLDPLPFLVLMAFEPFTPNIIFLVLALISAFKDQKPTPVPVN